jgi:tRNA modification GTPase
MNATTIYAPATGSGRAAISLIRISGPGSSGVVRALAGALPHPRRLSLRTLRTADGDVLDKAVVVWMPGPATFTGEDMAELHVHGGLAVRSAVMRALAAIPLCQLAESGAFSRRAFDNGRLDLTEAEGIADLIDAETEAQRRQAVRQLDGALGRHVADWRARLIDLLAGAEAALDFSDESDVDDDVLDAALVRKAGAVRDEIAQVLADDRRGERLRDGFTVVLAGPPNAGKSTLLNALSKREAAIVSATPGTTRDVIEVRCDLGGLPVVLVDTAGLREAADPIEAEGIRRTQARMTNADLVLMLEAPGEEQAAPKQSLMPVAATIRVLTKQDVVSPIAIRSDDGRLRISAHSGAGLDDLLNAIESRAAEAVGSGDALVTRERHRVGLTRCREHLDRLLAGSALPELAAEDLRLAVRALGEVAGRVGVEEMLDHLFAGFCIGK